MDSGNRMKELKLIIPIEQYQGQILTEKINGKIDALILSPINKTKVIIQSELGFSIFEGIIEPGTKYIPIRVSPVDNINHRFNFQSKKYNLNEKLIISIQTSNTNEVKLIIRYD